MLKGYYFLNIHYRAPFGSQNYLSFVVKDELKQRALR